MTLSAKPLFRSTYGQYLLLIIVPVALYLKSLFFEFSPLDEQWLIVGAAEQLGDSNSFLDAFVEPIQNVYYRPFFLWALIADFRLGGLQPFFYHFSALLFHLLSVLLLFRYMQLLDVERLKALLLCLLFSVHPLLTHAVAWIPGQNDSMLCAFILLSLIQLTQYVRKRSVWAFSAHLLFFGMALFTKENALVLPLVYLCVLVAETRLTKRSLMLITCWGLLILLWYWARKGSTAKLPPVSTVDLDAIQKFLFAMTGFIGKILIPQGQSVTPVPATLSLTGGIITLAVLLFLFLRKLPSRRSTVLPGLMLFLLLLVLPVWYGSRSALGEQYEHRMYGPLAGLMISFALLRFERRSVLDKTLLLLVIIFGTATFFRMEVYRDAHSYLAESMKHSPRNYFLHMQMGNLCIEEKKYAEAIPYFNEAIRLQPKKATLYQRRGEIFHALGRTQESGVDFEKALQLYGINELGITDEKYRVMSFADIYREKLDIMNWLIAANPNSGILYVNRAKIYLDQRRGRESLADLRKACELEPDNKAFKAYYNELYSTFPGR